MIDDPRTKGDAMTALLAGVWPACPTALTRDEELDEDGMRSLVRFLVSSGVSGLWLLGGGGEATMLSQPVRRRAVEVAIEEAGSTPVVVGISAEGTRSTVANFRSIEDLSIAGVFTTPPYYYSTNDQETLDFFTQVVSKIDKPLIVYNNPHVASGIDRELARKLALVDQIAGIKDSSGCLITTQEFVRAVRDVDGFAIAQGYDQLAAASVLLGADGIVTGVACFAPRLMIELVRAASRGAVAETVACHESVLELLDRLDWNPYSDAAFITGVKSCLDALGVCGSEVSAPFLAAAPAEKTRVAEIMSSLEEHRGRPNGPPPA